MQLARTALVTAILAACSNGRSGPVCNADFECSPTPETPLCDMTTLHCIAACTADSECEDRPSTPYCDTGAPRGGRCVARCTADVPNQYVCVDGRRMYCEAGLALPCTVCSTACNTSSYCDSATMACAPRRSGGMPCTAGDQCLSGSCTTQAVCSVGQGEACTDADCDGVCAVAADGASYCFREGCSSQCDNAAAGGYTWTCVRFGYETTSPTYCVPSEDCIWESTCALFAGGTCGQSCSATGNCFTFCVPPALQSIIM